MLLLLSRWVNDLVQKCLQRKHEFWYNRSFISIKSACCRPFLCINSGNKDIFMFIGRWLNQHIAMVDVTKKFLWYILTKSKHHFFTRGRDVFGKADHIEKWDLEAAILGDNPLLVSKTTCQKSASNNNSLMVVSRKRWTWSSEQIG